jgi:ribonuclease Z
MFKVSMLSSSIARHEESYKLLKETLDLTSMLAPLVEHRGRAFGLVLEHQSGWKIV